MSFTNLENQPLSIAVWLGTDDYNNDRYPGRAHISATGLLKPTRMIVLSGRTNDQTDVVITPEDIIRKVPSRMGTALHASIEKTWRDPKKVHQALIALGKSKAVADRIVVNPTKEFLKLYPTSIPVYIEQRAAKEFHGYMVNGEYDFVGDGTLEDFKSTGVYGYIKGNKDLEHIQQGSIYRWLSPDIITSDHMFIRYIFTDWSKLDAMKGIKRGYPQSRIVSKKLKLMSMEETEQFIRNKINEVTSAKDLPENELLPCADEDLWRGDTSYKYFSNPNGKRATRNFDNYAEAHMMMLEKGKGEVRTVPGMVRRCGYCPAFELCSQKDEYLAKGILALP
jgi:hypothetical protein